MIHLLPKLAKTFPFLHTRAVTDLDLFGYCESRGVEVIFDRDISTGVWVTSEGKQYIFLNNKLRGWRLVYVFAHEVAHSILHAPSQSNTRVQFFSLHAKKKMHFEAESAAALMLLPPADLEQALRDGIYKNSDELSELISLRLELRKEYNI